MKEEAVLKREYIPKVANFISSAQLIVFFHVVFWVGLWLLSSSRVLPKPWEVWSAFGRLYSQGFAVELWTSFWLNIEALVISSIISAVLVYLSVAPMVGKHIFPYLTLVSKFRFMGLVGWSLAFTLMFGGGHYLKVSLMVFAITAFMVTALASVIANIPKERFDHARTLRMGEWRVVYEVVFRGTLAEVFDIIRQNAAIGWTMLTMVEGISRSEGGVGVMLLSQNKFFQLDGIAAIQLSILFLALFQDLLLGWAHRILFPYAYLSKERG